MMRNKHSIYSENDYQGMMAAIFNLMDKGENNLTPAEILALRNMALACERYENEMLNLQPAK